MTETTERLRYTFYCKRELQNPTQDSITSLQIFYYSVSQQKNTSGFKGRRQKFSSQPMALKSEREACSKPPEFSL